MERELEKILVSQWLNGNSLEELETVDVEDFNHLQALVKEMKQQGISNPVNLCRSSGMSFGDMSNIISAYAPALYESVITELFNEKARKWISQNYKESPEVIAKTMRKFQHKSITAPKPSEDPVTDLITELDNRAKEKPVSSGIKELDILLGGIRKSELTFVGARPSVGKSAFCFQVARKVAEQGKRVLFFPLEMSETALTARYLRSEVELNCNINNGIPRETWEDKGNELSRALDNMMNFYKQGNFLVFDRQGKTNNDPADLKVMRELIRIYKPYMIVVDQLEQVKESGKSFVDKRSRYSHVTHELQDIALREGIAVWCACQVNRDAQNSQPSLANLKESGTIEEDASNVLLLHRDGEKCEEQMIILDVAKQKEGRCGCINLIYHASRFKFHGTFNFGGQQ